MQDLLRELRRRNVFRAAIAYVVVAWLIAQVAELALDSFEAPAWVIKAVLLLLVLGLAPVVLFAWLYELTPEGLKRESAVDSQRPATRVVGRRLDYVIIACLGAAVVFLVVDKYALPKAGVDDGTRPSIAVLPFVNMSDDPSQAYFSDGISEELLNLLASVPSLHVAGRTSSFSFRTRDADLREIGRSLGVDNILEGSVRQSKGRVRIVANLVDTDNGFHRWSQSYERELTDIFAIQDEIATAVVAELKATLLGERTLTPLHAAAMSTDAHNAYLQGVFFLKQSGPEQLKKAVQHMEEAAALAPDSPLAWAGVAMANLDYAGQIDKDPTPFVTRARQASERAVQLGASVPEAHLAVADVRKVWDWDWNGARNAVQRALELRPGDGNARFLQAQLLMVFGDLDAAERILKEVAVHDPLNHRLHRSLVVVALAGGRYEEAAARGERLLAREGDMPFTRTYLCFAYLQLGRVEAALAECEKESVPYGRLAGLAVVYHAMGRRADSEAARAELAAAYGNLASYQQALVAAYRGETESALEWLEVAYRVRDPGLEHVKIEPYFAPLRDHPRYQALLHQLDLQ